MGLALMDTGNLDEALDLLRRSAKLSADFPNWPFKTEEFVRDCERMIELNEELPAILRGEGNSGDFTDLVLLARLCRAKQLYAAEARSWKSAVEEDLAKLGGNLWNVALAAARAGCGQGKDTDAVDDAERSAWRRKALEWLWKYLERVKSFYSPGDPDSVRTFKLNLENMKSDGDLEALRGERYLALLPERDRKDFKAFWAELDRLLEKARKQEQAKK